MSQVGLPETWSYPSCSRLRETCADVLTIELETALGGRQVVDGLTGQVIDVIGRCPTIRGIGQDASEYVGLVVSEAEAQASEADLTVIVECEDGEVIPPPRPTNIDHSRLWISIDGGVVTSAGPGGHRRCVAGGCRADCQ
jgi:hypothetical protein